MLYLIWAEDKNGLIGNNNKLPWNIPSDSAYFKMKTVGHTVVMGRNTFNSLNKKPLPNRKNIVLTRTPENIHQFPGELEASNRIEPIIAMAETEDIYVIGGTEIYNLFMPYADILLRTKINDTFKGNVYMPKIDRKQFLKVKSHITKHENEPELIFEQYNRVDF